MAAWLVLALGATLGAARADIVNPGAKPSLHVFLQLDAKSSAVEKMLRERLPQLTITVFGRYRDFEDSLTKGKPDVLLAIGAAMGQQGRKATLEGLRGGKTTEPYVLASVNQALIGPLTGKTIGVVDLLGREGTQALLTGMLKATDFKVKRVAKIEDLLPLLEFSAADGIVLPLAMLKRLVDRTRLSIKTRELADGVGLPTVAVLNPAVQDAVVRAFQGLDPATKGLLGVEAWSER